VFVPSSQNSRPERGSGRLFGGPVPHKVYAPQVAPDEGHDPFLPRRGQGPADWGPAVVSLLQSAVNESPSRLVSTPVFRK